MKNSLKEVLTSKIIYYNKLYVMYLSLNDLSDEQKSIELNNVLSQICEDLDFINNICKERKRY